MKDVKFVNAADMQTVEHYAAALLSSMISLRTLEAFHIEAEKKGLLDEDESETAKTMCWEIHRLIALYKTQIENVLDRTELDEKTILEKLSEIMPKTKKKRGKHGEL